ncbi:ATP-dependent DNA helicase PIF1-like protein [Tanacetum coccineum]|uniref:ATP-dependent DNA helicase n=1 Tax=Tanacetum coccineum TaxID=301880 RepID=A0ABQ5FB87_9ASTR
MGYRKSPNFESSSVRSSSFGRKKGKGVKMPNNVTMIKDIEPMLDNITVQGRVISLWHGHRVNKAHNPYSLDFVFRDLQNNRIQVYIKKDFMFRFKPLFEEDVIGSVIAIGDVVLVQSSSGLKICRTVVIEDDDYYKLVHIIFIVGLQLLDIQRKNICLTYIECMLRSNNKSLKDMQNMPYPDQDYTMVGYNRLINDETTYNKEQLSEQHVSLDIGTERYFTQCIDAGDTIKGGMFLFMVTWNRKDGSFTKTMSAALRSKGDIVLNVASSGIVALLLEVVPGFGGEFDILLPVPPFYHCDRHDVVNATINASYLWDHCTVLRLTVNMRLAVGSTESEKKEIQESADWILDIGNGKVGGRNDGKSNVVFSDNMLVPETDDDVMISHMNDDDSNFDDSIYTTEFLNDLRMAGVPHHNINLKIGAPVMLMRNIDQRAIL